jgi:hypothetical protein
MSSSIVPETFTLILFSFLIRTWRAPCCAGLVSSSVVVVRPCFNLERCRFLFSWPCHEPNLWHRQLAVKISVASFLRRESQETLRCLSCCTCWTCFCVITVVTTIRFIFYLSKIAKSGPFPLSRKQFWKGIISRKYARWFNAHGYEQFLQTNYILYFTELFYGDWYGTTVPSGTIESKF